MFLFAEYLLYIISIAGLPDLKLPKDMGIWDKIRVNMKILFKNWTDFKTN